ncbi:hypothetical protein [Alicyclobacillus sp. ALC3]|uniref:hypothetical protein n=1 Tax=Alicyclobacillus sp. ALC3 TaxID=2796143 RepID=UPI002377FA00|nr:hypothetical protein [Alicyclobacillus sp. ALC3]WDL95779.1 hypothetical protein JC200_15620 [Alicyclobacillus sp. ALC3]
MKTLFGYEAIEIAEPLEATLYDSDLRQELSVDEVLQLIETASRPIRAFTLRFWPESEEEAEATIIRAFRKHLAEKHQAETTLPVLFPAALRDGPIHPAAAVQATLRLVEQGRLLYVRTEGSQAVYRLPRDVGFSDTLQTALREVACPECARLDLGGPFHEDCLTNLVSFLQSHEFTDNDLADVDDHDYVTTSEASWFRAAGQTRESVQKLAKTALSTGRKLQERLKAVATARADDGDGPSGGGLSHLLRRGETRNSRHPDEEHQDALQHAAVEVEHYAHEDAREGATGMDSGNAGRTLMPEGNSNLTMRPSITQADLLAYLQSVDIVASQGEAQLRHEYSQAVRRMAEKERELEDLRRQRSYVEQQFNELQRDMDTVLNALQIAKRRDMKPEQQVIDAHYE